MIVSDDGPPCYCGCRGCLESLASGSAIGAFGQTEGLADARAVFAAARNGKTGAQAIVDRALAAAAAGAWTVFHTFLPRRLILGGGIAEEHFDLFAAAMNGRLRKATQFTAQAVEIVRAQLGNAAGMIGAAALVLR